MVWLKDLAHGSNKTVVLVTHAVSNLRLCDSVVLLHEGPALFPRHRTTRCCSTHGTDSIEAIYGGYQHASAMGEFAGFDEDRSGELPPPPEPHSLNTAPPPGSFSASFSRCSFTARTFSSGATRPSSWLHLRPACSASPDSSPSSRRTGCRQVQKMEPHHSHLHRRQIDGQDMHRLHSGIAVHSGPRLRPRHVPGHPAHVDGRKQRRARNRQGARCAR